MALLAAMTQTFIPKGSKPLVCGTYSAQGEATALLSKATPAVSTEGSIPSLGTRTCKTTKPQVMRPENIDS